MAQPLGACFVLWLALMASPTTGARTLGPGLLGKSATNFPVMTTHLLALGNNCKCEFKTECSCEAAGQFMDCIETACTSGHCQCASDGPHHFMSACEEMAAVCPHVGLECHDNQATCVYNGTTVPAAAAKTAAPAAPRAEPQPQPKEVKAEPAAAKPGLFPVPTSSRCVVIICCVYMCVFLALAVCRTYMEFTGTERMAVEGALRAAAGTVAYGPMLCVLFIACRLRVQFLSDGKGEPQIWVQNCMYATTLAVLASTVCALLVPLLTGVPMQLKAGARDNKDGAAQGGPAVLVLEGLRYLILMGLYGGIAGVIYGITTYTPPGKDDWTKLPPSAPAVMCTMILTVLFFVMQLVVAGARTYTSISGVSTNRLEQVMNNASDTVSFAPMVSILFLAARMRALQHGGQPQEWAQNCMFATTGALAVTALLAILVPLTLGGTAKRDSVTEETTFQVKNKLLGIVLIVIRYLSMMGMYVGSIGVLFSVYLFKAPAGKQTLPVSPTVQCVGGLCMLYFFVYFLLQILTTLTEVTGGQYNAKEFRIFAALDNAKAAVAFAPMLSILFVTTRMYALLLTDQRGAPQAWVQDGMFMASWSLEISVTMCLLTGLFTKAEKSEADAEDAKTDDLREPARAKFSNVYVAAGLTVVRYLCLFLLYGGIACIIYGLFTMTPETANGRGSLPVLTDAIGKTPMNKPPPVPMN